MDYFYFLEEAWNTFLPRIFYKYGYPFYLNIFMNKNILSKDFKNAQIKNTVKYRNEKSRLRPSIMFIKLFYFSILSFLKKIIRKFRYSDLQISGIFDIFFVLFTGFTSYSLVKLILINLQYLRGSKLAGYFLQYSCFF